MYGRIRKRNSILRVCEIHVCEPCEGLHLTKHIILLSLLTSCLFFDLKMQGAQARPHASKNDAFETPHRSVHTPSANTGVQMVGLWYAVPTLVIIGKGFPLSPHGEAECQVSMHTHTHQQEKNILHSWWWMSMCLALQCFLGLFMVFGFFGQGETPDKNS